MANTFPTTQVTVEGLPGSPTVDLYELNITHGARWGEAIVGLPEAYAFEHRNLRGAAVTIKLGGTIVMRGHVVRDPSIVAEEDDTQVLSIADQRWEMSRVKIGQHGVGSLVEGFGGFSGVGLRIHFNPKGYGNRSEEPDGDEVYSFSTTATAQRWTLRQMLHFILFHYYPNLVVDDEELGSAWDTPESDVYLYLRTLPEALTLLARHAGESWALRYNGEAIEYQPVGANPPGEVTVNLPEAQSGERASAATAYSALHIEVTSSIVDNADRIEVHSAGIRMETMHSNYSGDLEIKPLLISPIEPTPKGYARMFIVDVTAYETWKLGKNLPEGSKPKRWMRQNLSRVSPQDGSYLNAEDPLLKTHYGRPILPEECCWINLDGGLEKYRLLSGITIRYDQGIILIHQNIRTAQGSASFVDGAEPEMRIWITLTTELELPVIYLNTPATHHIDADHRITVPIFRSEIIPQQRYKSLLPDLREESSVSDWVERATEAIEVYVDITDDFQAVYTAYAAGRLPKENMVVATLLDVPAMTIGSRLRVSPQNADLTGTEIITEIHYNVRAGAFATVYATNNFARLLVDDV
jgi:hypothetical protein